MLFYEFEKIRGLKMRPVYFTFLIACGFFIIFACSQENNIKIQKLPKYADSEFITLEELFRIDTNEFKEYYIYRVRAMDVDSDTNLYILDYYESTVTVFDESGKLLRAMGGKGQGPNELDQPYNLSISDEKMYIYLNGQGMKILDLKGKYIDFIRQRKGKKGIFRVYKVLNNFYIWAEMNPFISDKGYTYSINKYAHDFELINNIIAIVSSSKEYPRFRPSDFIAINSKQHIYFPEKADEYKINKYDLNGNLLLSFGRKYKSIPYSKQVRDYENKRRSTLSREIKSEFPKYPPVVRYILIDDHDYVWVVVGECFSDCSGSLSINSFQIISTIDIFNEDGEFLYTFESPYFGTGSFIKNGRLYSVPTEDDLNIRVFKIHYNY